MRCAALRPFTHLILLILLTVATLVAGPTTLIGPNAAYAEPGREIAYRTMNGEWKRVNESDWTSYPAQDQRQARLVATYNPIYLDVVNATGIGFDDPVDGATRRATVSAVFAYIDTIIDESGTLDIEFQESQTDGSGSLASAGPFVHLSPTGFHGGFAFDHLTTGVDPSPAPDALATVDFGYTWNSGLGAPSAGEFDLFSVLLHEITHGLGILSFVEGDGTSAIANTANEGVYTLFDDFLETSGGKDLLLSAGKRNLSASDVTSNDVVFAGPISTTVLGSVPPIYSPSPYDPGSSIGHFDFSASPTAVMTPAISSGTEKRTYDDFEIGALADIGYTLKVSVVGDAAVCEPAPLVSCVDAAQAKLQFNEKSADKAKMKLQWKKLATATLQSEFGNPAVGLTSVAVCIYDDGDALVEDLIIDRGGDLCSSKPCWSSKGTKGYAYKDKLAATEGVAKIGYKAGAAGKGKVDVGGKRDTGKGLTAMPTGVVAALAGNSSPTIQIVTSQGFCAGATMTDVKKDDGLQYSAQKK